MSIGSSSGPAAEHKKPTESSLGGPFRVILLTLLIFFFSQIAAALIVEALGPLFIEHRTLDPLLTYSAFAQFVYILIAESIVIGSIIILLKRRGLSLRKIGWGRRLKLKDFTSAIGGYLVFFVTLIVIVLIISALIPGFDAEDAQDVGFKNLSGSADRWLAFVSLVLMPPLGEEFLVRGYLYTGLRRVWAFIPAMIFTSLFFGAAHLLTGENGLLWPAAVGTFVLSVVLVYLRERTGALYAGMLVHALNNLVAFTVYFS